MRKGERLTPEQRARAWWADPEARAKTAAKLSASLRRYYADPEARAKTAAAAARGPAHPNWKGGRHVATNGYVWVRLSDGKPTRHEHRIVMEQLLGRPLLRTEVVHHVDGNRANNDPANLALFPSHAAHKLHHVALSRAAASTKEGHHK